MIPRPFGPKVVEAHGYVVPADSLSAPKVIPVDESKLKRVPAGRPKVVATNTNIHPAGTPRVVVAGTPRVCTPGQDTFQLPRTVPAVDSPFVAGVPEVVLAKSPIAKDRNPQNFNFLGKLQGLKHSSVRCMIQDRDGNLWIGTPGGGVSRYDGKSFTHFSMAEGLTSNNLNCLFEDRSGNLWFGTSGQGLSRYDGKMFTRFTTAEGLPNNTLNTILQDRAGNLWFGTDGGVSRYDGKTFTHYTTSEGLSNNSVWSIVEDRAGNLWFGTFGGGVSRFDGRSFTHFTVGEGLSGNFVFSILEDRAGNLWFGTQEGGVCRYDGKVFAHFTVTQGLSDNSVHSILEDRAGNLWFGTDSGVSRYNGKTFTLYTRAEGFSNGSIYSILEDRAGNLWFAAEGGVSRYDGYLFTHFTTDEGLSYDLVYSSAEDRSGNLWFGTSGGGVSRYDGKTFAHFTTAEGLPSNYVFSILEDRAGNIWFGTFGGGVIRYDGKTFTHYTMADGLSRDHVYCSLEDRAGNLWFGTAGGGVSRYDGKTFTNYTTAEGLSNNTVMGILEDRAGDLWFGTYGGGLCRFDGRSFTRYARTEGLPDNVVWSVLEDRSGYLWFGTDGGGVSRYDGKTFTHFTTAEGLSNNYVFSILEDRSGNLWFGTRFGLNELTALKAAEIGDKLKSGSFEASDILFKNFAYEDGFLGIGCFRASILEDRHGDIWIGANDRLTAYHPAPDTFEVNGPVMQITAVSLYNEQIVWSELEQHQDSTLALANGVLVKDFRYQGTSRWYGLPEALSLAHDNNSISFSFIGITMSQPHKVKYQYKLDGQDAGWSELSLRTEAHYGNLPHGRYTFRVKAMDSAGRWSDEFQYPFAIRPPWWLTWWAYALYAFAAVTLVWRIHKFQQARTIRREHERIQARELEQAREIEKAYSELKAAQKQLVHAEKMASLGELTAGIAHEIQNPLNFVNNFADINAELIHEMRDALDKEQINEARSIAADILDNEEKIKHHGRRADGIVKGMLQHSRMSTGVKESTDINQLVDEYLRLAYHGLRAKDKSFSARFETELDDTLPTISVVPQDIGRVVLNLINNAFYAVSERQRAQAIDYEPTVIVRTRQTGKGIEIVVQDNGNGIPEAIRDKIFQPFFTTKAAGQGTGLGLSLSYDIVKAHGGEIQLVTHAGVGTTFIILLPI